jgi:hypothetical protein
MKVSVALLIALSVLLLIACGNSGQQSEAISMNFPSEEVLSPEPLVYYYFIESTYSNLPAGSVIVLPEILALAPAQSEIAWVSVSSINIGSSLGAMIDNPGNQWTSDNLAATSVSSSKGHTTVALEGEVTAAGDIVLIAFRMQVLLTVFADISLTSATVILNGECIGNLGISSESEAKPVDFAYTPRADIEAFSAPEA